MSDNSSLLQRIELESRLRRDGLLGGMAKIYSNRSVYVLIKHTVNATKINCRVLRGRRV